MSNAKKIVTIAVFSILALIILHLIHFLSPDFRFRHILRKKKQMTVNQFNKNRRRLLNGKKPARWFPEREFRGIYILHNKSKDMYYVGQGVCVLRRVNSHFSGRGNGDVYADWKYGDNFTIKLVKLSECPYKTLDESERKAIAYYDAYERGYNRTRGNGN